MADPLIQPNTDYYDSFTTSPHGDGLRCWNPYTHEEYIVAQDDIICILPGSTRGQDMYKILFVHKGSNYKQGRSETRSSEPCFGSIWTSSLPASLLSQHYCEVLPDHLLISQGDRKGLIYVIISVVSGTGFANSFFQQILRPYLSALGLENYEVVQTQSDRTITELTHSKLLEDARLGVPQTIILLSGDGGLMDIVDMFYHAPDKVLLAPPTIALIPTGTGNAMASSMGLLDSPSSALRALLRGSKRFLPVLEASFTPGSRFVIEEGQNRAPISKNSNIGEYQINPKVYGAVVASWGVHAALVADSDTVEYRRFGADRFKMAAKELLYPSDGTSTHTYQGKITISVIDDENGSKKTQSMDQNEHMYVLATLVPKLEKDFMISPASSPLDGSLRLVHFSPMASDAAMQLMGLAYQGGKHVYEKAVTYKVIEGFRVDFLEEDERWRRVCIDGKIVAVENGGWMEVRKESRRFLQLLTLQGTL